MGKKRGQAFGTMASFGREIFHHSAAMASARVT